MEFNQIYDFLIKWTTFFIFLKSKCTTGYKVDKYSTKEYIEEGTPFVLHQSLRDSLDIKSLGLDPSSEKKLLEAQNYKGI